MDFVDGQPCVNGLLVRSVDAMQGEISDLDDLKRQVMVRFPHEKVDTYKTTFGVDCFRDSFAERKPTVCWQHKLDEPIGHASDAQVTRTANEMVAQLDDFDAVPLARRAFEQIRSGTLTDWSFGFRDPEYEPHPHHRGVRRIRRARMKEMSPVTIGSIPGAIATGTREEQALMAEHSIAEIIALRDAHLISPEAAADMIRQMVDPSIAEHITIVVPEGGSASGTAESSAVNADGSRAPYTVHKGENVKCASCGKMNMPDAKFCDQCGAKLEGSREADTDEYVVPAVINGGVIMEALPEPLQRALTESEATLWITLGDDELVPASLARSADDGAVATMAAGIAEACQQGIEYFDEAALTEPPDALRQSYELFKAAGVASAALVESVDPDGQARAAIADGERAGAGEDMASQPVVCSECRGKGETEDGKTCPKCGGSGVEAQERAYWEHETFLRFVSEDERKKMAEEGVAMPNGDFPIPDKGHLQSALGHLGNYKGDKKAAAAHIKKRAKALGVELSDDDLGGSRADDMKPCPQCDSEGKLPPGDGGHRLTCPKCHGSGHRSDTADDDDDSLNDMVHEAGDGEPIDPEDKDKERAAAIEAERQRTLSRLGRRERVPARA